MTSTRRPLRDLAYIAVFAGIVAALGLVPPVTLPISDGIPVTAQSLGVMLAGAILGARRAFWSLLLFVALVALGLPLLAGGRGGLSVFVGPSMGFVVGFPFAAYAVGWFTERFCRDGKYRLGRGIAAALLGGVGVLYVFGAAGFMLVSRVSPLPVLVFIPGDIIKAVICGLVARGVHAAYPGLLTRTRQRTPETDAAAPTP